MIQFMWLIFASSVVWLIYIIHWAIHTVKKGGTRYE